MANAHRRVKPDPNYRQMAWLLAFHRIHALYHFTAVENLPTILRTGRLWSRRQLAARNRLPRIICGGDECSQRTDEDLGNSDYVALSFNPKTPMAADVERSRQLCYLVFNSRVALQKDVVFVNGNAASRQSSRSTGLTGLEALNLQALNGKAARKGSQEYKDKQSEVQIPSCLTLDDLEYIVFRSQASLDDARRRCDRIDSLPPFLVRPELFYVGSAQGKYFGAVSAELINRHPFASATTRILNQEQLNRILRGTEVGKGVAKLEDGISLVQRVVVLNHVVLTVSWTGPNHSVRIICKGIGPARDRREFVRNGIETVCTSLEPGRLVPGRWTVKSTLTLNDVSDKVTIDQFTIPFTVE